jgi:hypothetical protein
MMCESEETSITRQLLGKDVSATTSKNGTAAERRRFMWVRPEAIEWHAIAVTQQRNMKVGLETFSSP